MVLSLPILRVPCFVHGEEVRFAHRRQRDLSEAERELVRAVAEGGTSLRELAEAWVRRRGEGDVEETEARFREAFAAPGSLIGLVELEVPEQVDVLLVEQGYGGVYVHSVELHKKLRERWSSLLLSPVDPLFEPEPLAGVLTLDGLKRERPELDYFAWVQVVRAIVKRTAAKLVLLMHRSQSLFLFDLLADRRTIIYCDGFYDAAFRRVRDFRLEETPERRRRVLEEVLYLIANGHPGFYGIGASPGLNVKLLMAGGYSLRAATENWCWGAEQREQFAGAFPDLEDTIRLVLPFTDDGLFDRGKVRRERRVLFTTTMHNIDRKGFPELVRAMTRMRSLEVRCVVRQPERLPPFPPGVGARMEMGGVPKAEMVELYHRMWVNCRTSREESSPVSILESMSCELPQIVSPTVARQIPIIEDGATGFVVDPDDPDRLVRALRTILDDERLRNRMGRECRRRAASLSFDARAGDFERLLA